MENHEETMVNHEETMLVQCRSCGMDFVPTGANKGSTVREFLVSLTLFSPGGGGGGGLRSPPLDIFHDNFLTQENLALKFCDFFLSSLAQLLKEIFRKSDLPLQSHVSFCLRMSARKSLIFVICVQNIWKSHFSNKEVKHWLFGLV